MKITSIKSNEIIIKKLGGRIKSVRLSMSLTQKELAFESGISLRTITNIEQGLNISLSNIISMFRVLRILDNFELLIPEIKPDPFDMLILGKKIKRVSKSSKANTKSWKWGDEK